MVRKLSRASWLCGLALTLACSSKPAHSGKSALDDTRGGCPANYTCGLPNGWATSTNCHGVTHPSLRNYIALTSGDVQGIGCDCHPTGSNCNALNCERLVGLGSCGCAVNAHSIADDIEAAGLTWKDYGEDMSTACNVTDSGNYVARHSPFLYYDDILQSARCANSVVNYASNFASDLANGPPTFSLIAPNCNQGQGGTQLVCSAGSCVTGCNQPSDCPTGQSCDLSSSPGTCG